jgi:hypothetical protein
VLVEMPPPEIVTCDPGTKPLPPTVIVIVTPRLAPEGETDVITGPNAGGGVRWRVAVS